MVNKPPTRNHAAARGSPSRADVDFDVVLVGGGLQSGLIALACLERHADVRIALVEREVIGGEHLWSFHADDVRVDAQRLVEPLVAHRWPSFDVAFPTVRRTFDSPYASIPSSRFREVVEGRFHGREGCSLRTGQSVVRVGAHEVELDDGGILRGALVIDARGPDATTIAGACAYQKFVGLELALARPHGLARPMLMDATVAQHDGLRFFYVLPLAPDRVLVEETFYEDASHLDVARSTAAIHEHAENLGLHARSVERAERGVLPLPIDAMPSPSAMSPLVAGYAGGWFHPTTGYSMPSATRLAIHVAKHALGPAESLFGGEYESLVAHHTRQSRFALLLNRLLFRAIEPCDRRNVLERFHRLDPRTIRRFYALETTAADRARIVCGRPPRGMSLRAALASVTDHVTSRSPS